MIKKILILTFSLLTALQLFGQKQMSQDIAYIGFQPADLGACLRYEHKFINDIGYYISGSYGNYKLFNDGYINDHIKTSIGITHFSRDFKEDRAFISAGVSYHHYGKMDFTSNHIRDSFIAPFSVDFGSGIQLNRMSFACNMDLIKWNLSLNVGYIFNSHMNDGRNNKKCW